MCSPTLHVYFWHHFRSCPQRVRSPTLYHYNNLDMRTNISWFLSATMQLIQLFIHGNNRYLFPKRWNWQICHTHQAFKLPLHTLSGQLRSNISHCESNPTVYSSSLWKKVLLSYFQKKRTKRPLFWGRWYVLHTRSTWLHYVHFQNCWNRLAVWLLVL